MSDDVRSQAEVRMKERPLSRPAVVKEVDGVLVQAFGALAVAALPLHAPLRSASFDSIDLLDSVALLERHFGLEFLPADLAAVQSRAQLYDLVYRKLGGRESFAPARALLRRALGRG